MDEAKHQQYKRDMFTNLEERTEHLGIPPANIRIKQYKVRTIKRNIPSAVTQSQTDLKAGRL